MAAPGPRERDTSCASSTSLAGSPFARTGGGSSTDQPEIATHNTRLAPAALKIGVLVHGDLMPPARATGVCSRLAIARRAATRRDQCYCAWLRQNSRTSDVHLIAHIGNIPVEESLPFLVPVIAVYLYVRHRERRRRHAVAGLPDAATGLGEDTVRAVLARWSAADHHDLSPAHVALLYPPGPEGVTAAQLARRINRDPAAVDGLLEELAELGYVEFDSKEDPADRRAWLTIPGYDLVKAAEDELLGAPPRPA